MADLYVMVGLPGSGKSTWANNKGCEIMSSDKIRKKLFGNEALQYTEEYIRKCCKESENLSDQDKRKLANKNVFKKLDYETVKALKNGKNVIYDSTALSAYSRKNIIEKFKPFADRIVCVYMDTDLSICLQRNRSRERTVPESVIKDMSKRLNIPTEKEGFAEIIKVAA